MDITIPAGRASAAELRVTADDAINYGNLGALIGHELTHGFDDEGRHYDARGNLKDWWTARDAKAFEARASGLVRQYSRFVAVKDHSNPAKDVRVDGELTLGENTADNGGIRLAYDAFLATPGAKEGKDGSRLFARSALLPELRARAGASTTPTKPPRRMRKPTRTLPASIGSTASLMNMLPFREAFACTVRDPDGPGEDPPCLVE